ncbi:MAG TPA: hypothetical protein VJV79_30975, partial [Polyangiaceae bacterium]|nr:hypothetical protein [Polyangiaceae bacterium]
MRNTWRLIGALALAACSVDPVVVAALDDAGGANTGGLSGGSGSSGSSESAAGNGTSGGAYPQGGDWFIILSGGTTTNVRTDADAGATTTVLCSCKEGQATLCGSDGITYTISCEDGGTCLPPSVACW